MTRTRQPGKRRKTGNKAIFTNKQLDQVTLLTKLGATVVQVGAFFGVNDDTVRNWIKKDEDFKNAQLKGGLKADMKVAKSLYQRAIGFEYEETKSIRTKNGDFLMEVTKKRSLPDVKAIIHWLRVRQRETWSVVDEMNHNHNGKIEHIHNALQDIPVNELSKKHQDFLFEVVQKQLANGSRDN